VAIAGVSTSTELRRSRDGLAIKGSSAYASVVMRYSPSLILPCAVLAALLTPRAAGSEQAATVVARVGASGIDSSQLARSFGQLREFQRKQFGATAKAQLRGYLEQVIVRDLLLAEHGKKTGALENARVSARYKLVLGDALVDQIRKEVERDAAVSPAEIQEYYDAHPELFRTAERIRILRLLVETETDALALIQRALQLPTMDDWRNLVREKSKDKATSERGGDLGFVAADGTTDVPELEVDPALYGAAKGVKDGEVVHQPVPEGKRFAVVWRRGSQPARVVEFSSERARIRQLLTHERVEARLRELVAKLRTQHLRDHRPERLDGRDFAPASSAMAPSANSNNTPTTKP
jgi:peptidyl-prolyl cis-trans isomerase C